MTVARRTRGARADHGPHARHLSCRFLLVGAETPALVDAVRELLTDKAAYAKMASGGSPYGDGYAAQRVAEAFGLVKGSPCAA